MTEDQRRMRAAVETINNQKKQMAKIEDERRTAELSASEKDKLLDHLQERICRLEMCLDSGISLSRELSTLLSCNDHEAARWKDSAYQSIERFDRRLLEYGLYMGKVKGDS